MKPRRTLAVAAMLAVSCGAIAAQQTYPNKPIRWVTPYAPGGSTTALSRLVGEELSKTFGKPVIIDNRPGAHTMIGADAVAKATPDGYTILLAGNSQVVLALLMKPPYDVFKDFAPVTIMAKTNYILVVNPSLPANNLQEFIAYAKARPGQLNVASVTSGSSQHLMGELFGMLTGVKMQHIPYKGGQQGIVAPAGTPGAIVAKLSGEVGRILALREISEKLINSGMEPYHTGPEKMAAQMKADYAESARVIKTANIKIEE